MQKIGIFRGTFSPPHLGHTHNLTKVLIECKLDKIIIIPSHMKSEDVTDNVHFSDKERCLMLNWLIENNPYFELCNMEINTKEESNLLNTLNKLRQEFPEAFFRLFLILGADQWNELSMSETIESVKTKTSFIVVKRPGFTLNNFDCKKIRCINNVYPFDDISSTDIRNGIKNNIKRNKSYSELEGLVGNILGTYLRNKYYQLCDIPF